MKLSNLSICRRKEPDVSSAGSSAPAKGDFSGNSTPTSASPRAGTSPCEDAKGKDTDSERRREWKSKFSLSTLFKKVDRKHVPPTNIDTDKHSEPIRLFVGTWNMAFKKLESKQFCISVECTCFALMSGLVPCTCGAGLVNPLSDWIDLGYDIYFITLQESISPNFFDIISSYLETGTKELVRVSLKSDRLMGFGEGAYVSRKMTSIALWVRKDLLKSGEVKVGCSRQVYLSSYNRSKGVVCLQLKVFDQLLCLLGCHMPSEYMERQKALVFVLEKLSNLFGGNDKLTFKDVFHHLLWAGDFNFKLTVPLERVLDNITTGTAPSLIKYDEFYHSSSFLRDQNFCEESIQFNPTYKKKENRPVIDESDDNWIQNEYSTSDVKWYNGNPERVPSWTDRVFKWSDESMEKCLEFEPGSYKTALPKSQTPLLVSDHSPVSCSFTLRPVLKTMALPVKLNVHSFK